MKKLLYTTALFALGLFFTSCEKTEIIKEVIGAEEQFVSALNLFEGNFLATPVSSSTGSPEGLRSVSRKSDNVETIFLSVSSELTATALAEFESVRTMQDVLDFTYRTGAIMEFEPTESNTLFQLDVYTSNIEKELTSMVSVARQYLHAVGFKEHEIQKMLTDTDLTEFALISLAILYQYAYTNRLPFRDRVRDWEFDFQNCMHGELYQIFNHGSWIRRARFIATAPAETLWIIADCMWYVSF